jgi:predicted phosphodiesterase
LKRHIHLILGTMSASISTSAPTEGKIKTRFLVLSDTHALYHRQLPGTVLHLYADVVLHCGDLTNDSTIEEYESSIRLLQALNAPLKLVIAGNHDFTLDGPVFSKRLAETRPRLDDKLVKKIYGSFGDVKRLFKQAGITFLDEGNHSFKLQNGASLNIYASPYTPSCYRGWGFQYHPNFVHKFLCTSARTRTDESSAQNIDIIMTHGPPQGILDKTDSGVRGCPYLFKATARARPLMHCFGHIHEGWGAKLVTWRQPISTEPSHLTTSTRRSRF